MLRFSEMTPQQKTDYEKYYNEVLLRGTNGFKLLNPSPVFNEHGLRFPLDYLKGIGTNVILLPIEYMANYADITTVTEIDNNNNGFIEFSLKEIASNSAAIILEKGNATTIGNMAYFALYCKNPIAGQAMFSKLIEIFEIVRQQLLKLTEKKPIE